MSTGAGGGPAGASCSFIYVIDDKNVLYTFDPKALVFNEVGPVGCFPQGNLAGGMAIDESGVVWATSDAGYDLYQIDPGNAHCTQTSFQPPSGFMNNGGVGFTASAPGGQGDVLYLSTSQALYEIDPTTWQSTAIGDFQPNPAPTLVDGPSLAGTSDARLFGLWIGPPTLGEIDPSNAQVLWTIAVPDAPPKAYSIAIWSGGLWIFTFPTSSGSIFRYDLSTMNIAPVMVPNPPFVLSAAAALACSP